MNYWQWIGLVVLVWFLGTIWFSMWFNHQRAMADSDLRQINAEIALEKLRHE